MDTVREFAMSVEKWGSLLFKLKIHIEGESGYSTMGRIELDDNIKIL